MDYEIYKEHILYHYRNPQNNYALAGAAITGTETNTLCGDTITVYANTNTDGIITAMSFTGEGCALSIAAASLLTDYARGKTPRDITGITQKDMEHIMGIPVSIVRARCIILPVKAFSNTV